MSEFLPSIFPLIVPLGIGGVGGFFVGYAVKKVYRLAMFIAVFVFSVAYSAYVNVIDLNANVLVETVSTLVATFSPFVVPLASSVLFMGSFLAGLLYGLTKG
ncbi:MAG: hypothetical protein JSV57_04755 [Candidatus Bathyarchaeota archaeon]|nr:MAG: hypothetical protein JSV57_04755 [Candidatus Bathyarchaeota archaeon]